MVKAYGSRNIALGANTKFAALGSCKDCKSMPGINPINRCIFSRFYEVDKTLYCLCAFGGECENREDFTKPLVLPNDEKDMNDFIRDFKNVEYKKV